MPAAPAVKMQDFELGHAGLLPARETLAAVAAIRVAPAQLRPSGVMAHDAGLVNVSVADGSVSNLVGAGSSRSPLTEE